MKKLLINLIHDNKEYKAGYFADTDLSADLIEAAGTYIQDVSPEDEQKILQESLDKEAATKNSNAESARIAKEFIESYDGVVESVKNEADETVNLLKAIIQSEEVKLDETIGYYQNLKTDKPEDSEKIEIIKNGESAKIKVSIKQYEGDIIRIKQTLESNLKNLESSLVEAKKLIHSDGL